MTVTVMADCVPVDADDIPDTVEWGGWQWVLATPEPLQMRGSTMVIYTSDETDVQLQVVFYE